MPPHLLCLILVYAGLVSVSLIDLVERKEHTETILTAMPMGRMGLGRTSDDGNADFRNDRIHLRYTVKPHRRRIQCVFRDFQDGKTLKAGPSDEAAGDGQHLYCYTVEGEAEGFLLQSEGELYAGQGQSEL